MAFCEECGSRVPDNAVKCPACGAMISGHTSDYGSTSSNSAEGKNDNFWSKSSSAQTNGLQMAENERVVRQYMCSNVKRPRCTGYLTVTNKRIIFQGKASTSRVVKEVVLDSVSGLDCYYGLNINVLGIVVGALLVILSLMMMASDGSMMVTLLALVLGVLCIIGSIQKSFFLSIFSSKASGSPISIGAGARTLMGNGALYSLVSEPTHETDRMLNELGALVQDLQTLGDHAIEKWSK